VQLTCTHPAATAATVYNLRVMLIIVSAWKSMRVLP
jgi:hypothetical protein